MNIKNTAALALAALAFTSCVSKKKYTALQNESQKCKDQLVKVEANLARCLEDQERTAKEVSYLKNTNQALLNNVGNLSTLSRKEAENLEKSLESIKEKDTQIKTMREAITKKDSVTLALVTSLKGALGNLADEDIEINVEKGVVYVSISDKLLFNSGSYQVSDRAKQVLSKVAKVVNNKPEIDIMVEGHTDDKPIQNTVLQDNWDLSVKRATSVVRILQEEYNVDPKRMTAAGRSSYIPVAENESREGRAKNRRTRIIVLPKLDQYFGMIEEGMKNAK